MSECNEIREGLDKGKGMPWATAMGYIELWHRVHRAEETLIKVEPCGEALGWAMHDESSLMGSNLIHKDLLLRRLRRAVAILDDSETGENLHYLAKPAKCSLSPDERKKSKNRAKATTVLSEVRYEINNPCDKVWEGIVDARNRLTHTSVLPGFDAYALLGSLSWRTYLIRRCSGRPLSFCSVRSQDSLLACRPNKLQTQ